MSQAAAPIAAGTPGASLVPDTTELFTAAHLLWVALFAALAIAVIVWGMRQRAKRRAAEREVERHNAQLLAAPPLPAPLAPAPTPPAPTPPAPTPPAPTPPVSVTPTPPPTPAPPVSDLPPPPSLATPPIPPAPLPTQLEPAAHVAPPAPAPAASGGPADGPVTLLKGLGPKVAARLAEFGITTVGQIAALTDDEASELDARLGTFSGRMTRDRWLEQARFLAAGDRAGFEAVFGKLS